MTLLGIDIPEYGDKILYNGKLQTFLGVHVYLGKDNKILSYMVHIGHGKFITIELGEENERQ